MFYNERKSGSYALRKISTFYKAASQLCLISSKYKGNETGFKLASNIHPRRTTLSFRVDHIGHMAPCEIVSS